MFSRRFLATAVAIGATAVFPTTGMALEAGCHLLNASANYDVAYGDEGFLRIYDRNVADFSQKFGACTRMSAAGATLQGDTIWVSSKRDLVVHQKGEKFTIAVGSTNSKK